MTTRRTFLGACSLGALSAAEREHRLPATDHHYKKVKTYIEDAPLAGYQWASEQAYEKFRDIKYGVRIHWGLYSIGGVPGESWPFLKLSHEEKAQYNELYQTWNPAGFDANGWMNLFAESGLKMFAFTTKHHDGFSLWDTKANVRRRVNWRAAGGPKIEACNLAYSVMEGPFRRDIVGELCTAARRKGIAIDLYYSHPDWYDADFRPYNYHPLQCPSSATLTTDYDEALQRLGPRMVTVPDPTPEEVDRMIARHRAQLTELLTKYGSIDMLCLDQWLGPKVWPRLRETILHLRKLQPDVMLRARGIGNYGDYYTPEGFVPGNKENTDTPWFVIHALGSSFSYDPNPAKYKGAGWIIQHLVDSTAKGGNFMVGIGPDGMGRFHPTAIAQLKEAGEWLALNGHAIFATRPRDGADWKEGDRIRFTRSKDRRTVHAFALEWPGREFALRSVRPRANSKVRMSGFHEPLPWRYSSDSGLTVELPSAFDDPSRRPCRHAWSFTFETAE